MTEQEAREAIVAEAVTYLGTPFVDCQHVKGAGVDCGMMPLSVYATVGVMQWFEPGHYSVQIHQHKTEDEQRASGQKPYRDFVREHMREIPESEVKPGDFVLYFYGKCFSHGAIVIEWPHKIIHACAGEGVIFDDPARNGRLMRRRREFYTVFGGEI